MDHRAGLLIIGHGSEHSSGPLVSACGHAERLLDSGLFAEARVAFLMAGEDPCETLEAMRSQTIHIIPLFMCDGYYTRTVIPKKLKLEGSRTYRDGGLLIYGSPIGVHPGMADILRHRALETCSAAGWDPSGTRLMVIGHGSPKSSASAEITHRHAREIRKQSEFISVECAFIDEAPKIEDWLLDLPEEGHTYCPGWFLRGGRAAFLARHPRLDRSMGRTNRIPAGCPITIYRRRGRR